jgi:hypothetical protein
MRMAQQLGFSNSTRVLAIKFTIYRRLPSGSPGDANIFGSQQ